MELPTDPEWAGWHFTGRHLISPHRDRITADVLAHLVHMHRIRIHFETVGLSAQAAAARRRRQKRQEQLVKVVVVDMCAWRREHGLGAA